MAPSIGFAPFLEVSATTKNCDGSHSESLDALMKGSPQFLKDWIEIVTVF